MQLHLVLFALFIYTIFKEDNYTSHLYPRPPPTGIAVEYPGLVAGQLPFDCPRSAREVWGL